MLEFNTLAEFSRSNCIAICAFLVPANLITTLLTMILAVLHRPSTQIWQAARIACIFAFVMVLHVYSWFAVGVVMAPTFILLSLAVTCLSINLGITIWQKHYINTPHFGR
ncbi:MAG: hypothetical protein QNJ51_24575 [Calothrix sp. MO_167.B12]|nr:hypothetical protein [Calothrix sp. MO_167.B12]